MKTYLQLLIEMLRYYKAILIVSIARLLHLDKHELCLHCIFDLNCPSDLFFEKINVFLSRTGVILAFLLRPYRNNSSCSVFLSSLFFRCPL